jgi:hypothetical protein
MKEEGWLAKRQRWIQKPEDSTAPAKKSPPSSHPENQESRKGGEGADNVPCDVRISMSEEAQATEGN